MIRITSSGKKTAYKESKNKGYFGISKGIRRMTIQRLEKGWQYATEHRRKKRNEHRSIWIQRINAATREHNLNYSKFMFILKNQGIYLNRKMLAEMAVHEPLSFFSLVSLAKNQLK
ncbi:MAG: 50S ribosomal protein L20 [Rhodospirillaceae bacterium]|nr:MAG: 50S ribosomal protein L20 [Rhodospirillaceae bacterium]